MAKHTTTPPKDKTWIVPPHPETGTVDPDAFAQAMVEASSTLLTVGGCLSIAPVRQALDTEFGDLYATRAVIFNWQSFVPALEGRFRVMPVEADVDGEQFDDGTAADHPQAVIAREPEPADPEEESFPDHPSVAEPQPAGA